MTDLNANVDATQEWLPLTDADSRSLADGFYTIDTENVKVENGPHPATSLSITPYNGRRAVRGVGGSTAASHLSGATLTRYYPDAVGGGASGLPDPAEAPDGQGPVTVGGAYGLGPVQPVLTGTETVQRTVYVGDEDPEVDHAADLIEGDQWVDTTGGEPYQHKVRTDVDTWVAAGMVVKDGAGVIVLAVIPSLAGFQISLGEEGADAQLNISAASATLEVGTTSMTLDEQGAAHLGSATASVDVNADGSIIITGAGGPIELSATGVMTTYAGVIFGGLPTADPVVAGALWNDTNTVKVSAG